MKHVLTHMLVCKELDIFSCQLGTTAAVVYSPCPRSPRTARTLISIRGPCCVPSYEWHPHEDRPLLGWLSGPVKLRRESEGATDTLPGLRALLCFVSRQPS